MTLPITTNNILSLQNIQKQPSIVLAFDGIDQLLGSASILSPIRIGDDITIGDFIIGASIPIDGQITSISFDSSEGGGTSTRINYRLSPDLGVGESITSLRVALVDTQANEILALLAANEFLGRKVRVLLTPDYTDNSFPEDYITIFRGIVDDISLPPGMVVFNISHPDQKKRQTIFTSFESELDEAVDISETSIDIVSSAGLAAEGLLQRVLGPDGTYDASFSSYIRVDDEIISYTTITSNTISGGARARLGSVAATHSIEAAVKSFYRLEGNPIDLALKIMLSGWTGPFVEDVVVSNFNYISSTEIVSNAMFFEGVNVSEVYGLTEGDYVTTTGADDGANNVTLKQILEIVLVDQSSYIVIDDVTFVDDFDSNAVVAFRSKYDTLPVGFRMSPDEVDVAEHERLRDTFLSSYDYDIYIKDTIENGKDFLSKELYRPIACYSVPRKSRSSVAYLIGPLPTQRIKTLDTSNVLNANKIFKKRSIGRNFYNTVIYKYDEDALEGDFLKGYINTNATSKTQIPVGNKAFVIVSKGLRATNVAQQSSTRLLNRYAFAANYIEGVQVNMETGFNIEVADLVIVDGVSLKLNDASTGEDTSEQKLYEVISTDYDIKTGRVTLGLVDSGFQTDTRYALISPASYIKSATSGSQFVIESSFESDFGANEYLKWQEYGEIFVRVRNIDYTTAATGQIDQFSGNSVTLKASLGFTPSAGMLMELSDYGQATEQIKLMYTHITDGSANFPDGNPPYLMI